MSGEEMKTEGTRNVFMVLSEYLAARDESQRYARLRAELLQLIGADHSHDPSRCLVCMAARQQNQYGQQGLVQR